MTADQLTLFDDPRPFTLPALVAHVATHPQHDRGEAVIHVYDKRDGHNEHWAIPRGRLTE